MFEFDMAQMPLLFHAVNEGKIDFIVTTFFDKQIELTDSRGRNLCHIAAACGQIFILQWLHANELESLLFQKDQEGAGPILYAAFYGQNHVIEGCVINFQPMH